MTLSPEQKAFYDTNGYLLIEDAVTADQLAALRAVTQVLTETSRAVTASDDIYDLDTGHSADNPRLTRVRLPHERHPLFWEVLRCSRMTQVLTDLLGPDTNLITSNLITSKLNTKAPEGGREVEWHQDWAF